MNPSSKLRKIHATETVHGSDRRISSITVDGRTYAVEGIVTGMEEIDGVQYMAWLCTYGQKKFWAYSNEGRKDGQYWIEYWIKGKPR